MTRGDDTSHLRLVVALEQDSFAARYGGVASRGEAAHAVVRIRLGHDVSYIDVVLVCEIGIEGDADQAALPGAVDGEGQEGMRQHLVALGDAERASLLADEDAAIGGDLHRGRRR